MNFIRAWQQRRRNRRDLAVVGALATGSIYVWDMWDRMGGSPVERTAEGWRCMDSGDLMAWGALAVNFSTFTPLVPARSVELPWRGAESDGNPITIDRYDAGNVALVFIGRRSGYMPLTTAVEAGHALIAAAAEARS